MTGGATKSIWMVTASMPHTGSLTHDVDADVCIVGAGITGLTTAYLLAREGQRVVVLDQLSIGGGETGRTTAHLSDALDDRYATLEKLHGTEGARLAAASHRAAIDRIAAIVSELNINCDYERLDGYLFVPRGESRDVLDDEARAAHRAGLTHVELVERAPIAGFDTGPALRFPQQGQFHPLRYLAGLAHAIEELGGQIYTHTHVTRIRGGRHAEVTTEHGHHVRVGSIVVATNSPINDRVTIHTKQAPYRTYVVAARIPRSNITRALYWDTPDPYHYVRFEPIPPHAAMTPSEALAANGNEPEYDLLICGGEDHKTGQADDAEDRYDRLERWARERWPAMEEVEFRWSGQVLEPVDGLAYIGPNPHDDPNVYIATGDSGHGMTHGTIAGMLLTDLIMGRPNPYAELYSPARKRVRAIGDFLRENVNVAAQYTDYALGWQVSSPDEVLPGTSAIIRQGLKLLAVHRDEHGHLHVHSAVCTHLGCVVRWNSEEKSWDCPCHGSRFGIDGRVLCGPASAELPKAELAPEHAGTRVG